VIGEKQKAQLL